MKSTQLVLQCFAEKQDNAWCAVCVTLTLAAQADTLEEAKQKLKAQIAEYIYDVLEGEDKAHAAQLIPRKAPLSIMVKYQCIKTVARARKILHFRRALQPRLFTLTAA